MFHSLELPSGETPIVESDPEVYIYLVESRRQEANAERRYRRNEPIHIEAITYEGPEFADWDTPEELLIREEESKELTDALSCLTNTQFRRLLMYSEGYSITQIAKLEKVSKASVNESIESARIKMQKLL